MTSTPTLSGFDPRVIPYQYEVIDLLRRQWDYSKSTPQILLSGAYGSAKSTLIAHLIVTHCLNNDGACACIARRALPDIKRTIYQEILEHIEEDLVEGVDYSKHESTAGIKFANGSKIIAASWADKRYKKFRSLKLSFLAFEEIVENDEEDAEAFRQLSARLRRISSVKENILIAATNPDSPAHWVHSWWMDSDDPNRKVFYSITTDNPFLDEVYVQTLLKDLDPKQALRYVYGQWIELAEELVYYAYDKEKNHRDYSYKVNFNYPVYVSWDFNIGQSKPLSCCLYQYLPEKDEFHFFNEVVVEGMRTLNSCDELAERGLLDYPVMYVIQGDASGRARDTRSLKSDYEQIEQFFSNYEVKEGDSVRPLNFVKNVPISNPPIKTRHNLTNSYCKNALGERRLFTYKDAPTCRKGLSLVQLKKGGKYIEDDSKDYQHVTTAIGYGIVATLKKIKKGRTRTRQL